MSLGCILSLVFGDLEQYDTILDPLYKKYLEIINGVEADFCFLSPSYKLAHL